MTAELAKTTYQKKPPRSVDAELKHAIRHFDRAVEVADDEVQLFKIRRQLHLFLKEISP
ncbi:MAG: hypothetical protein AAF943_17215 [Pseudomonadota bacterium]